MIFVAPVSPTTFSRYDSMEFYVLNSNFNVVTSKNLQFFCNLRSKIDLFPHETSCYLQLLYLSKSLSMGVSRGYRHFCTVLITEFTKSYFSNEKIHIKCWLDDSIFMHSYLCCLFMRENCGHWPNGLLCNIYYPILYICCQSY